MKTANDLYTPEDLFRVGNAAGPKLDHVRERDITVIYHKGKNIVLPDTGGISVFNKIHLRMRGIWWKCPAGTPYPKELMLVCDSERKGLRHYSIQPTFPMELREFQAILRKFAECFERVEE
jgi:hypothetical protein